MYNALDFTWILYFAEGAHYKVLLKKKMILLPYFGAPPMSNYY
jgi:hypothetical protein